MPKEENTSVVVSVVFGGLSLVTSRKSEVCTEMIIYDFSVYASLLVKGITLKLKHTVNYQNQSNDAGQTSKLKPFSV